jgi:hypothetical protein
MQQTTELQWIEMAGPRWWARVYTLKAQTNCTIELAIRAVQLTDKDRPNETSLHHPGAADLPRGNRRISR